MPRLTSKARDKKVAIAQRELDEATARLKRHQDGAAKAERDVATAKEDLDAWQNVPVQPDELPASAADGEKSGEPVDLEKAAAQDEGGAVAVPNEGGALKAEAIEPEEKDATAAKKQTARRGRIV